MPPATAILARPPRIMTASAPEIQAVAPTPLPQAQQPMTAGLPNTNTSINTPEGQSQPSVTDIEQPNCNSNSRSARGARAPSPTTSLRSPTRPLSPDLPNKDALYVFANFSSYMRSPHEGSQGIKADDFRDTIRLLDYARLLASQPQSNVHILHLKYRFDGPTTTFRSPYSTGDYQLPLNYRDAVGRLRNPVPQPFSVLHDPVVKIDYLENGSFDPLPAQAIWSHIAKMCQPPPRIIVMSYVYSKVTENHLASLSAWATTSAPPAYVFSPLETRIRESRPLHLALHHAIPMSMYAWPCNSSANDNPSPLSPYHFNMTPTGDGNGTPRNKRKKSEENTACSPILLTRRLSASGTAPASVSPTDILDRYYTRSQSHSSLDQQNQNRKAGSKRYSTDPIASLTVITSSADDEPPTNSIKMDTNMVSPQGQGQGAVPVDRIPLWHLAPGVGVLHGSTSASIGVNLSDFSAINLINEGQEGTNDGKGIAISGVSGEKSFKASDTKDLGIKTTPMRLSDLTDPVLPVPLVGIGSILEHPISRPSSTTPAAVGIPPGPNTNDHNPTKAGIHLTPPEMGPRSLALTQSAKSQSWPAPVSKVPGWRKGRKEMMEDTLEEIKVGPEPSEQHQDQTFHADQVVRRGQDLGLVEEESQVNEIMEVREDEEHDGGLLHLLAR